MNKHNINKILMTIGIGISLIAFQTAPVFADEDPITIGHFGNSKGINTNTSAPICTTTNKTSYVPTYDWDSIRSVLEEHVHAMQSGANLGGTIPDTTIQQQYVETTTDEWTDSSGNLHSNTTKTLHPRIYVTYQYSFTNHDVRKNEKVLYYDWKLVSGPTGAIAPTGQGKKDVWTTPGKTSTVSFFEIGKYTIQSVPFYEWNRYDELFYSMTLIQGDKTITTKNEGFLSNNPEHKTGEYTSQSEQYNMTIATQDLNQTVTVHTVDTTTQYDVQIKLIE